ncbi:MAG TPA: POTRA domain-containing protein, partial [Oculatellaceae cyanobacterium]
MHSKMGWLWREVLIKEAIRTATDRFSLACALSRPAALTLTIHSQEAVASLPAGNQTLTPTHSPKGLSNSSATSIANRLFPKLAPFCVGIVCTSATGAIAVCASELRAIAAVPSGSTSSDAPNDPTASFLGVTPLIQALEQESLPHVTHETFLQAQNLPTNPPLPPENLEPNPNEDRFLQPSPIPAPVTPDSTPPVQPPPTPAPTPDSTAPVQPSPTPPSPTPSNSPAIQVQKIKVTGSTVFTPDQLNSIVQPYEGRSLTVEQLREVADKITQLYLDRGYITSRAILVDQAITEGAVEIRVLEGSLEEIRIEGARRLHPNYIRKRVRLGAKTPLNTAQLEDQLRLLRADPLFENVEASLRAGTRLGQSILIVRVVEANPFEGSAGIDNYSPPSVGSERLGINLLYRNLTGNGDAIATSYNHTTRSGADDVDVTYRLPVNAMNGAVQIRTAFTWNKIVEESFSFFDIQGDSQLYEISFQQPLVRSPREEFSLSLGLTHQISKALIGVAPISPGANSEGITTTSVIKFAQDYVRRDIKGAWSVRSLFSFGTGLFGATTNTAPVPDGQFFSWLGQVQRVQVLNSNNFLIMGADIQLTPNTLVPSQQFVIGGG